MTSKGPVFSIVVPTRNRPNLLAVALQSIADQTFRNYEVIIVDDGADEEHQCENKTVVERFGTGFKLLKRSILEPTHGPSVARNAGIAAALGQYVGFLDDDDYWCDKHHLKVADSALSQIPGADYFLSDQMSKRGDSIVAAEWLPYLNRIINKRSQVLGTDCYQVTVPDILRPEGIGFPHPNTSIVRRDLLELIDGFWERTSYEEDPNFSLRLLDRIDRAIYRPKATAVNVLRQSFNSAGASSIKADSKQLWRILVCEHASRCCRSNHVRAYIRLLHSGVLKRIAKECYDVNHILWPVTMRCRRYESVFQSNG
jgi:glycosyltransferase involved in cell wall biosynthesis